MSGEPRFLWSQKLMSYDFGPSHPMSPLRLSLTHDLLVASRLWERLDVVEAPEATREDLLRVHTADYLAAVQRRASQGVAAPDYGLGDDDTPVFSGMHSSASRIVGASTAAARAVWRGECTRAINLAGGMHHAMAARASGFCVYNDAAVAIAAVLAEGASRVLYIDIDAHHGDGVERAFWDDDRVLTVSIHQHPGTLFPGTGFVQDVGGPSAQGYAVNIPLPARTPGSAWQRAFDGVVPELVAAFDPELVVSQHGCDSHGRDPLAELDVEVEAQLAVTERIESFAERYASGRWVALGGGGYDVAGVVPRAWAGLVSILAGAGSPAGDALPAEWVAATEELTGEPLPTSGYSDRDPGESGFEPWAQGIDPDDEVDRVVSAVRHVVYPSHGLPPSAW